MAFTVVGHAPDELRTGREERSSLTGWRSHRAADPRPFSSDDHDAIHASVNSQLDTFANLPEFELTRYAAIRMTDCRKRIFVNVAEGRGDDVDMTSCTLFRVFIGDRDRTQEYSSEDTNHHCVFEFHVSYL